MPSPTPLPSHEAMVANILAAYRRATPAQVAAGDAWYPLAGDIVRGIADAAFMPVSRVALTLAALSPRNPWRWNVADAYHFVVAARDGEARPSATTFGRNTEAAWKAAHGDANPWKSSALKVRAFAACIAGDEHAVVVDTWATRVATAGSRDRVATDAEYRRIAAAYDEAAWLEYVSPSVMQAITWTVALSEGGAPHATAYKVGTPDFLNELPNV